MIQYYSELNQLKIADFVCELNWMIKKHSSNEKQLYWANSAEKKELGQSKKRVHKKTNYKCSGDETRCWR